MTNKEKATKKLIELLADVFAAKFGTKNRSELITRLQGIILMLDEKKDEN